MAKQLLLLAVLGLLSSVTGRADEISVPARLAERSLLLDVAKANGHLVTVGERGHILVSRDRGQSWEQKKVPTRTLLTRVFFINEQKGWAVGHDQTILHTDNGGETWHMQHQDTSDDLPLFDIWFADEQRGLAVGAYALFLVTEDGGQTWEPISFSPDMGESAEDEFDDTAALEEDVDSADGDDYYDEEPLPFDYHLMRLAVADSGALYLASEAGYVFRSEDQGKSWQSLPSPYEGSFFGVTPLAGDRVLLYGLRGNLFRSEDAGKNWKRIETATKALLSNGGRLSDGTVLVTGAGGLLLVSTDDGKSFQPWRQKDGKALSALLETEPGKIIVSSAAGVKLLDIADFRNEI